MAGEQRMKCEMCGNRNAVVFVQQIIGDTRSEMRLCAECAKERGLRGDGDIAQSVAKLLAAVPPSRNAEKEREGKACPVCGLSTAEARKNGSAGCPSCWDLFAVDLFRKVYKDVPRRRHVGRLPVRLEDHRSSILELAQAKERLESALKAEDYETAARCRDRIRVLENREVFRA